MVTRLNGTRMHTPASNSVPIALSSVLQYNIIFVKNFANKKELPRTHTPLHTCLAIQDCSTLVSACGMADHAQG